MTVGVVIVSQNRRERLLETLDRLAELPERPPVVVVDNGSADGTAAAVRRRHPALRVLRLPRNSGAAGRTEGVRALDTPVAAFSDDDSWWAPGALGQAGTLFERHPRLGLVAARILVGPERRLDPTSAQMRLGSAPGDGAVLGFVACGALVRRRAFLGVGGFHPALGIGGEEHLLALDLAAAGWDLAYADEVVAHHHPQRTDARPGRRDDMLRNELWTAWMRRRAPGALVSTLRLTARAARERQYGALCSALRGVPWVLRERKPVPRNVERAARRLGF